MQTRKPYAADLSDFESRTHVTQSNISARCKASGTQRTRLGSLRLRVLRTQDSGFACGVRRTRGKSFLQQPPQWVRCAPGTAHERNMSQEWERMNVCYRDATVEDAAGIANVEVLSQQSGYRAFLPAKQLDGMSLSDLTQRWQSALQSDDSDRTVVAARDEKVIGFVRAGKCKAAGVGGITYLFVLPEYWGTGVGAGVDE